MQKRIIAWVIKSEYNNIKDVTFVRADNFGCGGTGLFPWDTITMAFGEDEVRGNQLPIEMPCQLIRKGRPYSADPVGEEIVV